MLSEPQVVVQLYAVCWNRNRAAGASLRKDLEMSDQIKGGTPQEEANLQTASEMELRLELLRARVAKETALAQAAELKLRNDEATRRTYEFFGEVSEESALTCISTLGSWAHAEPGRDIHIILNSPGGEVTHGLAIYDFLMELRARGHKITITVEGEAASMASVILQAADVRLIGPFSWIMIHEVASVEFGKVADMEDQLQTTKRMQDQLVRILSERSLQSNDGEGLTVEAIKATWHKKDIWMTAEEALAYHLVDAIAGIPTRA
jgi:ATP-dependent Clp endopeptidase proteolytic subunit ClpP